MSIRLADEKDVPAITGVYIRSWYSTYRGLLPESLLNMITPEGAEKTFRESFRSEGYSYFVLLAEDGSGALMGYLDGGKDRESDRKDLAEVYGMYLPEPFQKQGWGRELFREAFLKFRDQGFLEARTWVLQQGLARGFYEKMGGRLDPETRRVGNGKDWMTLVSYRWNL